MILVVGCGSIGQRHIRNLRALGEMDVRAYDPDRSRLAEAVAIGASECDSLDTALAASPAAVLVCTPPALHAEDALRALAAGAHVFIEKPLSISLEEADAVLASARASGRVVVVGHNLRFDPGLRTAKRLLGEGAIGKILMIMSEFGQHLGQWRRGDYRTTYSARREQGGGIVLDASHELDYVRWLAGEARSVAAMLSRSGSLEVDVEDAAVIIMRMRSGALATVSLDMLQRSYARRCKLVGSDGSIEWDLKGGLRLFRASDGAWQSWPPAADLNAMYLDELRDFLAALRTGTRATEGAHDARSTLAIALAAKQASTEQREIAL